MEAAGIELTSIATPEDVDDMISELLLMVKVPPFMEITVPVDVSLPPDTFKDPPVMEMGKPAETTPPDTVSVPDDVMALFRSRVPDVVNVPVLVTPPLNSDLPDEVLLNVPEFVNAPATVSVCELLTHRLPLFASELPRLAVPFTAADLPEFTSTGTPALAVRFLPAGTVKSISTSSVLFPEPGFRTTLLTPD